MKRLTLIIIGVLLCTPLYSDMNTYVIGSGGGGDYLVQEDFEGTGTPTGWTQYGQRPLPNFDYTATVLEGDQSMHLSGTGWGFDQAVNTPEQTAGTDRYTAFMYQMPSISPTDITTLEICNGSTTLGSLKQWINGALIAKLTGGTEAYSASGVISINTTYYTKVRWQAGSPAVLTVWISSDGQNWTQAVQANDVNITDGMTHVRFRSKEDDGVTPIIDDVRISDDDINY